jgi:hypothetical protein
VGDVFIRSGPLALVGIAKRRTRDLYGAQGETYGRWRTARGDSVLSPYLRGDRRELLYLQAAFVRAAEGLGLDWVINLKDNQPELWAEAQRLTAGPAPDRQSHNQDELQLWHAQQVYWPVADRDVRVVKTVRRQQKRRIRIDRDDAGRKRPQKEVVVEQTTNFYASNLELGAIPPVFVHQLGRSRWVIETELFQTITTDGHLKKHPYIRGAAKH